LPRRCSRFHSGRYVFGAILLITARCHPFIVYTSLIFAILGLRAMYFVLAFVATSRPPASLLGFALVLLSMFFFYVERYPHTRCP
jgi:predicted tellurium resistance membrane protein TerC